MKYILGIYSSNIFQFQTISIFSYVQKVRQYISRQSSNYQKLIFKKFQKISKKLDLVVGVDIDSILMSNTLIQPIVYEEVQPVKFLFELCKTDDNIFVEEIKVAPKIKVVEEIKNLFSTFTTNCNLVDKERRLDLDKFFAKQYECSKIREELVKKTRILTGDYHYRRYCYKNHSIHINDITPFTFRIEGSSTLTINNNHRIIKAYDIIGKSIKGKLRSTLEQRIAFKWGMYNENYIWTQTLKDLLTQNGIQYKKSWSRKKLVQELIKL